jgi:hypothetical protein
VNPRVLASVQPTSKHRIRWGELQTISQNNNASYPQEGMAFLSFARSSPCTKRDSLKSAVIQNKIRSWMDELLGRLRPLLR